jgi:hypothetical protein
MRILCFCLAASLAGGVGLVKAELPPQAYIEQQQKAGEELRIRVDDLASVSKGLFNRSSFTDTVKATVLEVVRSKSGVKKDDVISITYQRLVPDNSRAGPSPVPKLKEGNEYTAFLTKGADGKFTIAAQGMSFSKMK